MEHVQQAVTDALMASPLITGVHLWGSRSRNDHTPLSDWDFKVDCSDFESLAPNIAKVVASLTPLAQLWEPFAHEATYMLVLDGPAKVDVFFGVPPDQTPVTAPASIDEHFWDWMLWLGGKTLRGDTTLVSNELIKMQAHLLAPITCTNWLVIHA
jgi:predicted nucleotidyltransferase